MGLPPVIDLTALRERAERFALAQEDLAARAQEDATHWHHVMLANLIRDLVAAIPNHPPEGE